MTSLPTPVSPVMQHGAVGARRAPRHLEHADHPLGAEDRPVLERGHLHEARVDPVHVDHPVAAVPARRGERPARRVDEELRALRVLGAARDAHGHARPQRVGPLLRTDLHRGEALADRRRERRRLVAGEARGPHRQLVVAQARRLDAAPERRAQRVGRRPQDRAPRLDAAPKRQPLEPVEPDAQHDRRRPARERGLHLAPQRRLERRRAGQARRLVQGRQAVEARVVDRQRHHARERRQQGAAVRRRQRGRAGPPEHDEALRLAARPERDRDPRVAVLEEAVGAASPRP